MNLVLPPLAADVVHDILLKNPMTRDVAIAQWGIAP